jgi:hypothetical protein
MALQDSSFKNCRWFKRVWTLQELLAPKCFRFFDKNWQDIDQWLEPEELFEAIERITRIPWTVLQKSVSIQSINIGTKMKWAAHRKAYKEEDIA